MVPRSCALGAVVPLQPSQECRDCISDQPHRAAPGVFAPLAYLLWHTFTDGKEEIEEKKSPNSIPGLTQVLLPEHSLILFSSQNYRLGIAGHSCHQPTIPAQPPESSLGGSVNVPIIISPSAVCIRAAVCGCGNIRRHHCSGISDFTWSGVGRKSCEITCCHRDLQPVFQASGVWMLPASRAEPAHQVCASPMQETAGLL